MKKIIFIIIGVVLITGCAAVKKETNEQKMCKEIKADIESYQNNSLSFDDLRDKLLKASETYCTEESAVCTSIKLLKSHNDHYQKVNDCNSGFYGSNKAAHDACIAANKLAEEINGKVDKVESAEITSIKMECDLALEK